MLGPWPNWKDFKNTRELDRKEEEKSKLRIKNVFLFVVERFCLLIQMKSILLFYDFFFFYGLYLTEYIRICKPLLVKGLKQFHDLWGKLSSTNFYFLRLVFSFFYGWLFWFYGISTFVGNLMPNPVYTCSIGWGCRIHQLLLYRGVRPPPTSVLIMTLNNLMVRFQQCWSFGECGVPLHYHRSQVHSGPEW